MNENNGTDMLKSNADLVDNLLLYNDVKDLSSCPILRVNRIFFFYFLDSILDIVGFWILMDFVFVK